MDKGVSLPEGLLFRGVPLSFPTYENVAGSDARKLVCRRLRRERMSPDQKRPTALPPVAS